MARRQTLQHKKEFLQALEKSLGVITEACKIAGLDRSRVYRWMDKDPKFKQAVNDVGEVAVDFVESQLFQLIRDGNPASTIYYMKTKGRHRGYAERLEVTGAEGGPLQVHINMIRDDQTSDDID